MTPFYKYQASFNHFIVFNKLNEIYGNRNAIAYLCQKEIIGGDGIIYILKVGNTYLFRIFNRDGSEALTCGNGLRIAAKILLYSQNESTIKALDGTHQLLKKDDKYFVSFKKPEIVESDNVSGIVNNGNLHHLKISNDLNLDDLKHDEIYNHSLIKVVDRHHFDIVTNERGVGLTKSCGSASVAAYFFLRNRDLIDDQVTIKNPYGDLTLYESDGLIYLGGAVQFIYQGALNDELFK